MILPGVKTFFEDLRAANKNVYFVTNNTSKTRDEYVEKLNSYGVRASKDEIFGAGYLAAIYLSEKSPPQGKVFLCGNDAIADELKMAGVDFFGHGPDVSLNSTDVRRYMEAEFESGVSDVLMAFDPEFSYTKVLRASSYIGAGARFIVSNEDAKLPTGKRELTVPGVGALVASVRKATSKDPDFVCGKPSELAFDLIAMRSGGKVKAESTAMFGDRLDTDIQFGKNAKLTTVLTLTGVTDKELLEKSRIKPDFVIQDFTDLAK